MLTAYANKHSYKVLYRLFTLEPRCRTPWSEVVPTPHCVSPSRSKWTGMEFCVAGIEDTWDRARTAHQRTWWSKCEIAQSIVKTVDRRDDARRARSPEMDSCSVGNIRRAKAQFPLSRNAVPANKRVLSYVRCRQYRSVTSAIIACGHFQLLFLLSVASKTSQRQWNCP